MNGLRKRIIVAGLLTAALGLMLCPPWHGRGHRLLWNGRGSLDWSRLALELCLVAVIGALATVVVPMVGRPSAKALKVWFRRAGLVLGCAAVLILAATAGYDGIVRIALLRDYNQKVKAFQAKEPLLQEAFPLDLSPMPVDIASDFEQFRRQQLNTSAPAVNRPAAQAAPEVQWEDEARPLQGAVSLDFSKAQPIWDKPISNVHEAEIMLRSLGCDDRSIQRAMARFLAASTPEYDKKTLSFWMTGTSGGKGGDCLPKDIFDQVAAAPKVDFHPLGAPARPAAKSSTGTFSEADIDQDRGIGFDFQIRDSDAAKRFFAPLPDWYAEALQHKIEVARVPDWMKPGEPPASWSFTNWLDSRSASLIFAAGMLALSGLCFVVASRIDRATAV